VIEEKEEAWAFYCLIFK